MQLHVFDVKFPRRGLIQRAQHFLGFCAIVLSAIDLKIFAAPRNRHLERRFDLMQMTIERAAHIGEPLIVHRREGHINGNTWDC